MGDLFTDIRSNRPLKTTRPLIQMQAIPAKGQWQCLAAGMAIIGLMMHSPCVIYFVVSSELPRKGGEHPTYTAVRSMALFCSKEIMILPLFVGCLLYTSPSPRDGLLSRMPSSA